MAERLTQCKGCKKYANEVSFETIKEHNPETQDLNMRVTLKCSCGHVDEYLVASHSYKRKRRKGFYR